MAIEPLKNVTQSIEPVTDEDELLPFEEKMLRRVKKDFEDAKQNLKSYHAWCIDMHGFYHNAQNFTSLKDKNKFPSTAIQEDVDQFVADTLDKLFYAGRPATIIGREETDRGDAEVKQDVMDYQDGEDKIYTKFSRFIRDVGLYKICVGQVDFIEKKKRRWVVEDIPHPMVDDSGEPVLDENGEMIPLIIEGQVVPSGEKEWVLKDVVQYEGATVKRVDPMNVYFGIDKTEINDDQPIMIRSRQSTDFFKSQRYFFNADKLKGDAPAGDTGEGLLGEKRRQAGEDADWTLSSKPHDYIEWQGLVDKLGLYQYLMATASQHNIEFDESKMATILPDEKVWAICGVCNGEAVVQLRENPFELDRPNIIIGEMCPSEDSLLGISLSQKIEAVQRAEEDTLGMLLTSFKQSVNPWTIINTNAVTVEKQVVNKAGGVFETNGDPSAVVKSIQPPRVAPDIYILLERFKQTRQNQGGLQDIMTGQGEPGADTLGEANQALAQATLRMRNYLKSFEDTFVKPLYDLRNHINSIYLTEDYVYRLVGEKGAEWRKAEPEMLRADVDFICESSTRETNRAIIVQQMLQFIQIAPYAQQAGQPVRFDKMMAELARSGFNLSNEKVHEFFPLLRLEEEQGVDVDGLFLQNTLMGLSMGGSALPNNTGGAGEQIPQPRSEEEAVASNQSRNQTQVGRMS